MVEKIIITAPPEFHKKVREFCKEQDYTLSGFIRRAIRNQLKNETKAK